MLYIHMYAERQLNRLIDVRWIHKYFDRLINRLSGGQMDKQRNKIRQIN